MKHGKYTRRQFLRGAGGYALSIPFLPSLLPREAWSQSIEILPRLIGIQAPNGAYRSASLYPSGLSMQNFVLNPGNHTIRYGQMSTQSLPFLLQDFSASILSKTTLMGGFDIPVGNGDMSQNPGHGYSHLGGSYTAYNSGISQGFGEGQEGPLDPSSSINPYRRATYEYYLATSTKIYPSKPRVLCASARMGDREPCWWIDPSDGCVKGPRNISAFHTNQTSDVDFYRARHLFEKMFGSGGTATPSETYLVDRVIDDYKSIKNSNKLGASDRQILDGYLENLFEVQRRMEALDAIDCGNPTLPGGFIDPDNNPNTFNSVHSSDITPDAFSYNSDTGVLNKDESFLREYYQTHMDTLVLALQCNATRLGRYALGLAAFFGGVRPTGSSGNWHDISHEAYNNDTANTSLNYAYRFFIRDVYLYLVNRMNNINEANGRTLLDNSLVYFTWEHGPLHWCTRLPVIAAGSMGDQLNTGLYIDFRNQQPGLERGVEPAGAWEYRGYLWHAFLANLLQLMGLSPGDWPQESNPGGGYGSFHSPNLNLATNYASSYSRCNDPIPLWVKATGFKFQ